MMRLLLLRRLLLVPTHGSELTNDHFDRVSDDVTYSSDPRKR
jgi:hypothetical protein